jgi:enediyne polyketide synthase
MAGVTAPPAAVTPLLAGEPVVIAGYNGPSQTVVSGPADAVDRVCAHAVARGLSAVRVNVSHAFHSAAVAPAAARFQAYLDGVKLEPPRLAVYSTVTGARLGPDANLRELLTRQVLAPVLFSDAVSSAAAAADLFVEVGPGRMLQGLAGQIAPGIPAISMEADSGSLCGLLKVVAAAYALGAPVRYQALFRGRYVKPLPLDKEFKFLASPCESAPAEGFAAGGPGAAVHPAPVPAVPPAVPAASAAGNADAPPGNSLELLRQLMAERAELPLEAVQAGSNPIDDLHLSSITVGQIVGQAAQGLGLQAVTVTSAYATSSIAEIAQTLDRLGETARPGERAGQAVPGAGPWVRAFAVDLAPAGPGEAADPAGNGDWEVFAPAGHPLAGPLAESLRSAGTGNGVLLCLPNDAAPGHVPLMLAAARRALAGERRFVAVGGRKGPAGLAKTLHLEAPDVATTVIVLPADPAPGEAGDVVARITADVASTSGFTEVHYDGSGTRSVPVLRALARRGRPAAGAASVLTEQDVILVTGGGKGITAECAHELGRRTGARVAILGRSAPEADAELAANLARLQRDCVPFRYVRADVTSADQVTAAIGEIVRELGPVTAVLHGAGRNEPRAIASLDHAAFSRTLAPKVGGLEAILGATDPGALKLLVTFGSIIGRAGLRGEADYATANDWLTELTRQAGTRNPGCRCLALEWSVWAGAGMGERLGVLEGLIREGITPIPLEEGLAIFLELLADPGTPPSVVVMGRAEGLPTIMLEQGELPLARFIDRPLVHYPGVELVVETQLSVGTDPYLADHLLDGNLLLPAVLGMEAMAQAAAALTGQASAPAFGNVEFLRPIVVPPDGSTTIRIAVLAEAPGTVQAAIRSSDTAFQADHFRATLRYGSRQLPASKPEPADESAPLVPAAELYGSLLFQGDRFRRLLGYRKLTARECAAQIANVPGPDWFGNFLPQDLVLTDPGTRDALMHTVQCCIPDATVLPAGIERLWLAGRSDAGDARLTVHARELSRNGDTYLYDLDVYDTGGGLVEQWRGLRLHAVTRRDGAGPWSPALLGSYLELAAEPVLGDGIRVAISPFADSGPATAVIRRHRTALALSQALGQRAEVTYRPDGKPLLDGAFVSSSHGGGVTFAVASQRRPVGCDVELAIPRPEHEWAALLGKDGGALARLVASSRGEDFSVAATRVWGAIESLRKTGHASVTLVESSWPGQDRWALLRAGNAKIASFATTLRETAGTVVFSILAEERADD